MQRMILTETSYYGKGAVRQIGMEIRKRGFQNAFVVTDRDLVKYQVTKKVLDVLEQDNIPYWVYDDIKQNPTIRNVQKGYQLISENKADCIVAVGGGSVMDTAKAIGMICANPDFSDVRSLEGDAPVKHRSLPVIAVPTTAGTASEVTINYVITDEEKHRKFVCTGPYDIPAVAVVDPEMMVTMPAGLAAATGMDALTHAIEGYITKDAWEMTDMMELCAIRMIAESLRESVKEATIGAREKMGYAQYIAGMGFSNVGLGIVHGMAHPLGAVYDIPHGVANALLLPVGMEFNAKACGEKYREIAKAMGVKGTDAMTEEEYQTAAVQAVRDLAVDIGIPQKLSELGVQEQDIPLLAEAALADPCTSGNPREVTKEQVEALYRYAM